jgi:hypothetical protein
MHGCRTARNSLARALVDVEQALAAEDYAACPRHLGARGDRGALLEVFRSAQARGWMPNEAASHDEVVKFQQSVAQTAIAYARSDGNVERATQAPRFMCAILAATTVTSKACFTTSTRRTDIGAARACRADRRW